jgi:soluble lytic murein transglycosylase-like protein
LRDLLSKVFSILADLPDKSMSLPPACCLVFVVPWLALAGQAPGPETGRDPAAKRADMQRLAQKQRLAARAAMQASIDKQRASVAAGAAAAAGHQAPAGLFATPFFSLAPMPRAALPVGSTMLEAPLDEVLCDPVPQAALAPLILGAAQRHGLEPRLLSAVIEQESAFRPCAVSQKGAQGLMQLMPETAEKFEVEDPFDASQNIDAGARYLKELLTRYAGDLTLALGAYNAGPARVDEAGGVPRIPETTAYVSEILKKLALPPAPPE